MNSGSLFSVLPFAAAFFALLLAVASVLRKKRSLATWCFFAGMGLLGVDSVCTGFGLRANTLDGLVRWLTAGLIVKSLAPVVWLSFSLTYSRGDYREFLARWRIPLLVFGVLPVGLSLGFRDQLLMLVPSGAPDEAVQLHFGVIAKALNVILLTALVLILMNLEQTFRAAVGTMRWRIKFVILALAVIFGGRLYVRSQAVLFSAPDMGMWGLESGALLLGCLFLGLAYLRTGLAETNAHERGRNRG